MTTETQIATARRPWRIVVVDDSPDDRAEVRRMLLTGSDRRYRFVEAETGAAAIRAVLGEGEGPTDCLVVDYYLPDMDATEVLEGLMGPDGLPICPVVVLTGEVGSEIGRAVLRAGAQDYVGKAWLTPEAMNRAIENAVDRWGMARELRDREARLRESDERLRLAMEASDTGMWTWDLRADLVVWSEDCCRIRGIAVSQHESPGDGFFRMVHPDDRNRVEAALRAAVEGGGLYECEYRIVRADGEIRWVMNRGRAAHDAAGRPVRLLGTSTDITARKQAEERARENEERLRIALQASSAVGFTWDIPADRVVRFHSVEPALPANPGASCPMADVRAVVHPDDRDRFDANLRACLDEGTGHRSEFRIVRPDGSVRWLDEIGTLSRDAEGRPARLTGVARDVTDRKAAEAALEESEARLRLALAAARAGVWSWDVPTGAVTWSLETYDLFGLDPAAGAITYANWDASIYPEDRDRAIAAVRGALERRTPECRMEYRVVHPAAGVRWLMGLGRVDFADDGTPLRMSGINLDITDRKRAELALEAHERELQSLADNVPDILVRFDRELRHNFVNAAVEAPSGRSRAEFLGKTHRELGMPEDCCELLEEAIRSVFETGEARTLEFAYPTKGGERHYSARLIPEPGPDGRVERVLGIVHDVTERMRYEEVLRDQDRRKDEFLATLAHELRNPLAPLRSGLEILRLGTDAAAGEEVREMMGRQLAHLIRLVDDLLDVSRIRRGRIELKRGLIPVREVIEHAVEASRPLIDAAGHRLTITVPDEPVWLDGDLTRLAQVVANLLNNAAKYTANGGHIDVSVSIEADRAVICVRDDGAGIPEAMLSKVFGLFTQVDRTLDRAQGGLGIGLSLVRRLVEMHGGTIEASSPGPGRGSTFTVRLPIAPAAEGGNGPASFAAAPPVPPASISRRVLVVDDNADGADNLAALLDLFGHTTRVARDGPGAITAAREFRPDLVLLDIGLPGMDGYEVCRRLRAELGPASPTLVALTGWGGEEHRIRAREAGFAFHLVKPIDPERIKALLETTAAGDGRDPSGSGADPAA